jgi:outer membrane protein TolC
MLTEHQSIWRLSIVGASLLVLAGCATVEPTALSNGSILDATRTDAQAARAGVPEIAGPLTLEEAMARALKHNLDRRARLMEEALARRQFSASEFDMLPKLLATAGYSWRDNDKISDSSPVGSSTRVPGAVSQDRDHTLSGLEFSWSLLDLSLGYYGARQQGDRMFVAVERRRKAMHLLMQDVRTVYWRAAAAQRLADSVRQTIAVAEEALVDSRSAEAQRLRNPVDTLRYQRQLLENMRLLEAIGQELASAQVELSQLVNAPIGQRISLAELEAVNAADEPLAIPLRTLEEVTLANNADLREAHYNSRIARDEVRRTMARLFPNINVNWALRYDSDSYLVNKDWQEAGVQLSFNLFNLINGPSQVRLAEAGVALADQRRVAMQVGVVTQMHLARLALDNARMQFLRADSIYQVDQRLADLMQSRQDARAQSKLDTVSNATTAILSLLRRYQALAQVQTAENRLVASLGLEPRLGSVDELSLKELTDLLKRQADAWGTLRATAKP